MIVPLALQNLKLCQAFKGHNPDIMQCIEEISDKEFFIEDNQSVGYTINVKQPTQDKICKVLNPTQNIAILLPIDNRFIKNHKNGIADAAVFNSKDFHFVEFKTNASGNTSHSVSATYLKAMDQLKETLNIFESSMNAVNIDFRNKVNVECHVIVSETFPRSKSSEMTNAMAFAIETNGISLIFEREIGLK